MVKPPVKIHHASLFLRTCMDAPLPTRSTFHGQRHILDTLESHPEPPTYYKTCAIKIHTSRPNKQYGLSGTGTKQRELPPYPDTSLVVGCCAVRHHFPTLAQWLPCSQLIHLSDVSRRPQATSSGDYRNETKTLPSKAPCLLVRVRRHE